MKLELVDPNQKFPKATFYPDPGRVIFNQDAVDSLHLEVGLKFFVATDVRRQGEMHFILAPIDTGLFDIQEYNDQIVTIEGLVDIVGNLTRLYIDFSRLSKTLEFPDAVFTGGYDTRRNVYCIHFNVETLACGKKVVYGFSQNELIPEDD